MIGIAETHLGGDRSVYVKNEIRKDGWATPYSPAAFSDIAINGASGGCFLSHRSWLQTATPDEATAAEGQILPEGVVVWVQLKIQGMCLVVAFA